MRFCFPTVDISVVHVWTHAAITRWSVDMDKETVNEANQVVKRAINAVVMSTQVVEQEDEFGDLGAKELDVAQACLVLVV